MAPAHSIAATATTTYRLSSFAHKSVGTTVARIMISPPIIGVPRFVWWLAGPSARITRPPFLSRSPRIMAGPPREERHTAGGGGPPRPHPKGVEELDNVRLLSSEAGSR